MRALERVRDGLRRDQVFGFMMPRGLPVLDTSHNTILYLENISVAFEGFQAINQLNLYIESGELRSIIGPNGAGKTTMMDIVTGKTRPDSGQAWFGQTLNLLEMDEPQIANAGIGRKFQRPTVFENLSVFDNMELAMAGPRGALYALTASVSAEQHDEIAQVLETIGLLELLRLQAGQLSHGQKQWLEIGMLLLQKPKLLLIDEPVAGMTHQEMDRTTELLKSLAGEHTVVVVEHDMDFVRSLESKVTVLHQGSVLAEGSMDQVQADAEVRRVYLGE